MLDQKLDLAEFAYQRLSAHSHFEVPWKPDLTILNFRLRGEDELSRDLLDRINATGRLPLSSTRVDDRFCLRLTATNHRTRASHLRDALALIVACAAPLSTAGR
jgi:aromatic-L-amino-acid decarboxylase